MVVWNLRNFLFSSRITVSDPIDHRQVSASAGAGDPAGGLTSLRHPTGFSSRLALPLAVESLRDLPSRETRETVERSNASVLGFLLQGVDLAAMPRPADERLVEALAPLRVKLDMLIDMVGRLSYRDIKLPPVREIELGSRRIAWCSQKPWQRGDWLRIELYFDPTFREPVVLIAAVTSCVGEDRDEGWRIVADPVEMPESIAERLARLALVTQRHQRVRQPAWTGPKSDL